MTKAWFPKEMKAYADLRIEQSTGERFYVDRNRLSRHLTIDRSGRLFRTATPQGFVISDAGPVPTVPENSFSRYAKECYVDLPASSSSSALSDAHEMKKVPLELKEFCMSGPDDFGFRFTWEDRTIQFANNMGYQTCRQEKTRLVRMDYAMSMGSRALSLRKFVYEPTPSMLESSIQELTAIRKILKGIRPVEPSQNAQVVLHPTLAAVWIHEVLGHWAESISQSPKVSTFLGRQVAATGLTVRDTASDAAAPFSFAFDDEGMAPKDLTLLDNGVFHEPYLSIERSFFSGIKRLNGHARAQDFKFAPIPRMMNVSLVPGQQTCQEMISGVKEGYLLIGSLGGLRGPSLFQVQAQYGFEISGGKLGRPVYGPLLMGLHSQALDSVVGVSNEFSWIEDGGCLSEGQFLDQSGRGAPYLWLRGVQLH